MENRSAPDVFVQASIHVGDLLCKTIALRGECSLVVSGGSAIHHTLANLATYKVPWSSVRLYMADEWCLPRDDMRRNDVMVHSALVQPEHIKAEHFFQIFAELGPIEGAKSYAQTISAIRQFDIALLGVGPDGHIASLFPNHPSIENRERVVAVENSPKFPPNRVSVGLTMLRGATHRIVVVAGVEKSDLIARIQDGQKPPVALINPTKWFLESHLIGIGRDQDSSIEQGQTS